MSFTLDEDRLLFRDTLRAFLTESSPEHEVRRLMDSDEGYDADVWQRMAGQLGLQGLGIPERFGGSGFGPVEVGIALEEMGRVLLCAPYLATAAFAVPVLLHCGDDSACEEYLPKIADGRLIATVALGEATGRWDADGMTTQATRSADGSWRLTGEKCFVLDLSLIHI